MANKRIPAEEFWGLVDVSEVVRASAKEYMDWSRDYVKGKKLYLNDVSFITGAITELQSDGSRREVGAVPQEELDKARELMDKMTDARVTFEQGVNSLAKRYGVRPRLVDLKTGELIEDGLEIAKPVEEQENSDGD